MITILVGTQADGFVFALHPTCARQYGIKNTPSQIMIGWVGVLDVTAVADRWLLVAAMLTGWPEARLLQEGFEIRDPVSDRVINPPSGVVYLRSDIGPVV